MDKKRLQQLAGIEVINEGFSDWVSNKLGRKQPEGDNRRGANEDEYNIAKAQLSSVSSSPLGAIYVDADTGIIYIQDEDGKEYKIRDGKIEHIGDEFPLGEAIGATPTRLAAEMKEIIKFANENNLTVAHSWILDQWVEYRNPQ